MTEDLSWGSNEHGILYMEFRLRVTVTLCNSIGVTTALGFEPCLLAFDPKGLAYTKCVRGVLVPLQV